MSLIITVSEYAKLGRRVFPTVAPFLRETSSDPDATPKSPGTCNLENFCKWVFYPHFMGALPTECPLSSKKPLGTASVEGGSRGEREGGPSPRGSDPSSAWCPRSGHHGAGRQSPQPTPLPQLQAPWGAAPSMGDLGMGPWRALPGGAEARPARAPPAASCVPPGPGWILRYLGFPLSFSWKREMGN